MSIRFDEKLRDETYYYIFLIKKLNRLFDSEINNKKKSVSDWYRRIPTNHLILFKPKKQESG